MYKSNIVMAKSVRESCAIVQKPSLKSLGILVVIMAVPIMTSSGNEVSLTKIPKSKRSPHTTSKEATKYARNSGFSNPILVKRPTPVTSGITNF